MLWHEDRFWRIGGRVLRAVAAGKTVPPVRRVCFPPGCRNHYLLMDVKPRMVPLPLRQEMLNGTRAVPGICPRRSVTA
jgi:hypothetical protein